MTEAFAFGEEYCKAVTASNPPPVQLKLEKVYVAVSAIHINRRTAFFLERMKMS